MFKKKSVISKDIFLLQNNASKHIPYNVFETRNFKAIQDLGGGGGGGGGGQNGKYVPSSYATSQFYRFRDYPWPFYVGLNHFFVGICLQ